MKNETNQERSDPRCFRSQRALFYTRQDTGRHFLLDRYYSLELLTPPGVSTVPVWGCFHLRSDR